MALIKCPECEQQVSDRAKVCIHCGFPLQEAIANSKLYSLVMANNPAQVGSLIVSTTLMEVTGMPLSEAQYVASAPGERIFSHLPFDVANAHMTALTAKGIPVQIMEEEDTGSDEDSAIHPVFVVRDIKFPRKEFPSIECIWKKDFPAISSLFPNVTQMGARISWTRKGSENAEELPYSKLSLFNNRRKRIALCNIDRIDASSYGDNVFIRVLSDINKREHGSACLAVLGEIESVPTDEMSRKGVLSSAWSQTSSSVPRCPRCGSPSIQIVKQGFGVGKAAAGALLLGPVGLAAGAIGSNQAVRICVNCKHRF